MVSLCCTLLLSYSLSFLNILSRMISDFFVLCPDVVDVCFTLSVSLKSAFTNVAVGVVSVLHYSSALPGKEFLLRYISRLYESRLAMTPNGWFLRAAEGNEERETDYAEWSGS